MLAIRHRYFPYESLPFKVKERNYIRSVQYMSYISALSIKKGYKRKIPLGYSQGIILTLILAVLAKSIAMTPFFSIMGQLVIAILLGMVWRAVMGVPDAALVGISFSSKKLLRLGIILLGMRLNLTDIFHTGPNVFFIAIVNIMFTILIVYGISRWMNVDKKLGLLTACGTAICGAAAVVAIAPQIKANDNETAIGAATVAILGTIFTIVYTLLYPYLGLTQLGYGVFSGATLHEIAHVLAAAAPAGSNAVDMAVIVKLTRVALLVPVAIILGIWVNRSESKSENRGTWKSIPIPWFIFGFLGMSALNSFGLIPSEAANQIVLAAYLLIAMAMAGLGLTVDFVTFKRLGLKTFIAGFFGTILLSILGFILIHALHLN